MPYLLPGRPSVVLLEAAALQDGGMPQAGDGRAAHCTERIEKRVVYAVRQNGTLACERGGAVRILPWESGAVEFRLGGP